MQGNPDGMAGFPHPAPDRNRDGLGDSHCLATPTLAYTDPAHGHIYCHAHGDPPAICHIVSDTVSHTGRRDRSIGDDPPACCF